MKIKNTRETKASDQSQARCPDVTELVLLSAALLKNAAPQFDQIKNTVKAAAKLWYEARRVCGVLKLEIAGLEDENLLPRCLIDTPEEYKRYLSRLDLSESGCTLGHEAGSSKVMQWWTDNAAAKKDLTLSWRGVVDAIISFDANLLSIDESVEWIKDESRKKQCRKVLCSSFNSDHVARVRLLAQSAPESLANTKIPAGILQKILSSRKADRSAKSRFRRSVKLKAK